MPAHGVSSTHNTWHTSARWSAFFQTFLQASRRRVPRGSAKSTTGFRTRNRSSWRACSRRCVFLKKGQNAAVYHDISDLIQTNTVCRLRRLPLPSVELKSHVERFCTTILWTTCSNSRTSCSEEFSILVNVALC